MTQSILFSNYLLELLAAREITEEQMSADLGYLRGGIVKFWLRGQGRPRIEQLPELARVLRADPVEMVTGWVIDQLPELETLLRSEVLEPRGCKFPASGELTLRAPRPSKVPACVSDQPRESLLDTVVRLRHKR